MITYLVNSTLCSGLLFAAYLLLLKSKAMYHFNRYYLLAAMVFSLIVPLIAGPQNASPLPSIMPVRSEIISQGNFIDERPVDERLTITHAINYTAYSIIIYSAVTLLLLFRLVRNLYSIRLSVSRHEKVNYNGAQLVLIDRQLTPHTFLNYIFLNKTDYYKQAIDKSILHHELAHATQRHSADIILIELIQAIYWFNPFLFLYGAAIRINHEFIADKVALGNGDDVWAYQNLLIGTAAQAKSLPISSQFNYSTTKQRLIMMTKTTSETATFCTRLALVPILATAFILFCDKTEALQKAETLQTSNKQPAKLVQKGAIRFDDPKHKYPSTKEGVSGTLMNEYIALENKYGMRRLDRSKTITKPEEKRMEWIYQHMNPAQQKDRAISFMYPADPQPGSSVSRAELNSWKNPADYGVWLDGKRIKNAELKKLDPGNINKIFFSRLTDIAVDNDKFHYQIELMSLDYYKRYRDQAIANRNNSMIVFHLKS
jgi:bla regulator protein BlaR1